MTDNTDHDRRRARAVLRRLLRRYGYRLTRDANNIGWVIKRIDEDVLHDDDTIDAKPPSARRALGERHHVRHSRR